MTKKEIEKLKKELEVAKRTNWSVHYEGGKPEVIGLTGVDGKTKKIFIGEIVRYKVIDIFEKIFEQANLVYLSGRFPSHKHAYIHLKNRIDYELTVLRNDYALKQKEVNKNR